MCMQPKRDLGVGCAIFTVNFSKACPEYSVVNPHDIMKITALMKSAVICLNLVALTVGFCCRTTQCNCIHSFILETQFVHTLVRKIQHIIFQVAEGAPSAMLHGLSGGVGDMPARRPLVFQKLSMLRLSCSHWTVLEIRLLYKLGLQAGTRRFSSVSLISPTYKRRTAFVYGDTVRMCVQCLLQR